MFFIRSVTTSTSPPSIDQKKLQINECTGTMVEHIRDADPLELQNCLFCKKSFLGSLVLAEHVARVHLSPPKSDCATNGEQVARQCQSSAETGSGDPPAPTSGFSCTACDIACSSKSSLRKHFVRKHTDRYEHQCKLCPKKFKIKSDLTSHERSRHKEELVKCEVCGKLCANSASLYLQQKSARYELEFACQQCTGEPEMTRAECGKTFLEFTALKKHLTVHAENKPYNCAVCQKSFALQTHLMAHLLAHTGERPFECVTCGERFAQSVDLFSHKKSHADPRGDNLERLIHDFGPENLQGKIADNAEEEAEDRQEGKEGEYEEESRG